MSPTRSLAAALRQGAAAGLFACLAALAVCSSARAQSERDTFTLHAGELQGQVDNYNDWLPKMRAWVDGRLERLDEVRQYVESLDPRTPERAAWEEKFDRQRAEFYAKRAAQEQAMIRYRDLIHSVDAYLNDQQRFKATEAWRKLNRSAAAGRSLIRDHDEGWAARNVRPEALPLPAVADAVDAPPAESDVPAVELSGAVLDVEYTRTPSLVDVGRPYQLSAFFRNNDQKYPLWVRVQLIVVSGDVTVEPADARELTINQDSASEELFWTVTVNQPGDPQVQMVREIVGYWDWDRNQWIQGGGQPGPVASSGQPVYDDTPLNAGDAVQIHWEDQWWSGQVSEVYADGSVKIHYDGYDASWDEIVPRSRLQLP